VIDGVTTSTKRSQVLTSTSPCIAAWHDTTLYRDELIEDVDSAVQLV
jgi:hypothetical protein